MADAITVCGGTETATPAGRDVTIHVYPGVKHWFVEADRPEYNPEAAELAWRRTLDFLNQYLAHA